MARKKWVVILVVRRRGLACACSRPEKWYHFHKCSTARKQQFAVSWTWPPGLQGARNSVCTKIHHRAFVLRGLEVLTARTAVATFGWLRRGWHFLLQILMHFGHRLDHVGITTTTRSHVTLESVSMLIRLCQQHWSPVLMYIKRISRTSVQDGYSGHALIVGNGPESGVWGQETARH